MEDDPMKEEEVESRALCWRGIGKQAPRGGFFEEGRWKPMKEAQDGQNFIPLVILRGRAARSGNLQLMPLAVAPPRHSPFTTNVLAKPLLTGIKIPNLSEYNGTGDQQDHLDPFYAKIDLLDLSDAGYYKIFHTTLARKAMTWFNQLSANAISNFGQLPQRFLHHFSVKKRYPKTASYLFKVVQKEQESLKEYVQRFSKVVLEVSHLSHELLSSIMQQNLRRGRFKESIVRKP